MSINQRAKDMGVSDLVKRIEKLEEENKNLKEKLDKMEYGNSLVFDDVERICNEKLELKEEYKKLKEKLDQLIMNR